MTEERWGQGRGEVGGEEALHTEYQIKRDND